MLAWNRILCAVDFSEPSQLAMEAAADLVRRYESHLTLVHVHEAPTAATPEVLLAPPEFFEASAREKEQRLEQWRAEAQQLAARSVQSVLLHGHAAVEIVRAARDDRSDLVVIATQGRTGLKLVALGSVAERVVRQRPAPCWWCGARESRRAIIRRRRAAIASGAGRDSRRRRPPIQQ